MLAPASAPLLPHSSTAPDWSLVPFDVTCARCGHDLRGQSEATCPACGLEFDWAVACPLEQLTCGQCGYHLYGLRETRCPECGRGFDWNAVLLDYRRRQKDLFEYRWREQPIRSFLRTWARCFRPRRLWRFVDIHDPPDMASLSLYVTVVVFLTVAVWTLETTSRRIYEWLAGGAAPLSVKAILDTFQEALRTVIQDAPDTARLVGFPLFVWWAASIGILFVLRQSMARHRVRSAHLARIAVYACPTAIVLLPTGLNLLMLAAVYRSSPLLFNSVGLVVMMLGATLTLFSGVSIARAYRFYLRIPHPAGVALASQVAGLLCALLLLCWTDSPILGLMLGPFV